MSRTEVYVVVLKTGSETAELVVHENLHEAYNHYQRALGLACYKDVYLYSGRLDGGLGDGAALSLFDIVFSLRLDKI